MSRVVYTTLQIAGMLVFSAGCWMLTPWLGVCVLGVGLVLLGVLVEWERRQDAR